MAIRHVALRYMTAFQCRASECEDNCCHDWSVAVDREHYRALERVLGRERFARGVALAPANRRTRHSFAVLRLDSDDRCTFLDGNKLCSLHAQHGEAILPDACAVYPRVLSAAGERRELSGELSCPEVARRCLLAGDGTELVECAAELAGRAIVGQHSGDTDGPYRRYNGAIRGALYRLLSRRDLRVDERLFLMACFAVESSEFFTQATTRLDGARLTEELRLLEDEVALARLRAHFATLHGAPLIVTEVLARMLASWLSEHCAPRFRALVRAALESLAAGGDAASGVRSAGVRDDSMQVDPEWMSRAHQQRKAERQAMIGARLELILGNYCRHFVIRHWYTESVDLVAYVQQLLVRVATARLLIYCHPRVAALPDETTAAGRAQMQTQMQLERDQIVDGVAVEVLYSMTRALEHDAGSLRGVTETLRDKLPSLAHAVALLKL